MKPLGWAFLMLVSGIAGIGNAHALDCNGLQNAKDASCANKDIVLLATATDAAIARVRASGDPLTALLLRRDHRWFETNLGEAVIDASSQGHVAAMDMLQRRIAMLGQLRVGTNTAPAGEWMNALGGAFVKEISKDTLAVEFTIAGVSIEMVPI